MGKKGFVRLRNGLMEHLEKGLMRGKDLSTYVALHFFADYECGIAWKVCAPFIARFLNEKTRKIQDSLLNLEKSKYIKRLNHRGQITYYKVVIDKFETSNGLIIRIDKMLNKTTLAFTSELKVYLSGIQDELKPDLNGIYHVPIKEVKNIRTIEEKKKGSKKIIVVKDNFDTIPWSRSIQISKAGGEEEYLKRVDWWYENAKKDKGWKDNIKELYPGKEYNEVFKSMRRWLSKSVKKRKVDLNELYRTFCEDKKWNSNTQK